MTERFSDQFSFDDCEDEPIRTPGAIQAFGALRVLNHDLSLLAQSDNAPDLFSALPGARHPGAGLPQSFCDDLTRALRNSAGLEWPLRRYMESPTGGGWHLSAQPVAPAQVLVELEPGVSTRSAAVSDLESLVRRVRAARSVQELMQTAVEAIRGITGFDRVLVYRFAADWHGEVMAESREPHMDSYQGLHFPAGDIPPQARALYVENQIRLIADVNQAPSPIRMLQTDAPQALPDLSLCSLRAVSPIHLQYLRNMGVEASMSISIIRDGQLWGLVACHHPEPRHVSLDARMSAKLVGDVLSLCLRLVEDADIMRHRLRHNLYQRELLDRFVQSDELVPTLNASAEDLRQLFKATGFLVIEGENHWSTGLCPGVPEIGRLADYVRERMRAGNLGLYHQNGFEPPLYENQALTAAGLIALAPTSDYGLLVIWLRAEEPEEVVWAGRPEKTVDDPLNPRHSFSRWAEERRGVARAWASWEMEAAEELLSALRKLGLRQMERLQRLSESLERSNRDLEDFAFIASHDLQEPLRKIEAFASLVMEEIDDHDAGELRDYVNRIVDAAQRLRGLVSDLLTYSRVGRLDYQYGRCDWRESIDKVLELLDGEIAVVGGHVAAEGEFPVTQASPVLIRMVFQNLISNALKYRDTGRAADIRIVSRRQGTEWLVEVEDNGIGFEAEQAEAIFKPFHRLHSKSRYPGSGIGLAIVRKAAERLGAEVEATSTPGEGSCFRVRVPGTGNA